MPKKNTENLSFLIPKEKFQEAKDADSVRDLEDCLTELINTANRLYNQARAANNSKKFISCIKNYEHIKAVINDKKTNFQSDFIELYDLEACLAICQAQLNSINTKPTKKTQLNAIKKNIKTIKVNFDALNNRINKLESALKNTASTTIFKKLLDYRNVFLDHWKKGSNERKAHSYYNLAEIFKKKSDNLKNEPSKKVQLLTSAKKLLSKSLKLYNKAQLFDFANQTKKQIDELDPSLNTALLSENRSTLIKIGPVILTASGDRKLIWKASDKTMLAPSSIKNSVKISPSTKDSILSTHRKRKRESFDEHASFSSAKKSKSFSELNSLWQAESEKIIKQFRQIKIDDDLDKVTKSLVQNFSPKESFDERRAIAHNSYAVTIITEKLQTPELLHAEKISLLEKAKNQLEKSAKYYCRANLSLKSNEIQQCILCIGSSLKNLAAFINKTPIKSIPAIDGKRYLARSSRAAKNIPSNDRIPYYTRYTKNFFFGQFLEKSALKGENQPHTRQSCLLNCA